MRTDCLTASEAILSQFNLVPDLGPVGDTTITDVTVPAGLNVADNFLVARLEDPNIVTRDTDAIRRYYFKMYSVSETLYRGTRPITTLLNSHPAGFFPSMTFTYQQTG